MNRSQRWLLSGFCLLAGGAPTAPGAQPPHPVDISVTQAGQLPFRESGKLTVTFGNAVYFGTATYIRRYTGLTAGHVLYQPDNGFASSLYFQPGLYDDEPANQPIGFFAVLSGYQAVADSGPNSYPAFAEDMGFFVLRQPAPQDEWAAFSANPNLLTGPNTFLALGYAGQSLPGDELASVQTITPYQMDLTGLYQNDTYYTDEGMSGGPVYLDENGNQVIGAVNVAASLPGEQAESLARAITADVGPLLIDAEYTQGVIVGAVIMGPASVKAGATRIYRTGLKFEDGQIEGEGIPRRYAEIELLPKGKAKPFVTVTKLQTETFQVHFASSLIRGKRVTLRMYRNTSPPHTQAPLQTLTVKID